jgi:hypothetical protein
VVRARTRSFDPHTSQGDEMAVPLRTQVRMSVAHEQYKHLRTAAPAEGPRTRTLRWMEGLPPGVRPTALLRLHARIVNLIAATWRDPKAFGAYMESLLRDTRGNRRGFPPKVVAELVALKHYYDARGVKTTSIDKASANVDDTKRL